MADPGRDAVNAAAATRFAPGVQPIDPGAPGEALSRTAGLLGRSFLNA
jgi:hypothetical protein